MGTGRRDYHFKYSNLHNIRISTKLLLRAISVLLTLLLFKLPCFVSRKEHKTGESPNKKIPSKGHSDGAQPYAGTK